MQDKMKIKRLNVDDETVAKRAIQVLKTGGIPQVSNRRRDVYVLDFLNNPRNYFIVATENENFIGFVLAYELDRLDRPDRFAENHI